jgi:hypothetical protein
MAVELVTGSTGSVHVTSSQDGLRNAALFGTGTYVLNTGDLCAVSMTDVNTCSIAAGDIMMQGRHVHLTASTATIENGTQGYYRHDLVCLQYTYSSGVESASIVVVKGTSSTSSASDPSYTSGSIIDGDTTVQVPIARVSLSSLTATVALMVGYVKSSNDLETTLYSGSTYSSLTLSSSASLFDRLLVKYISNVGTTGMVEISTNGAHHIITHIDYDSGQVVVKTKEIYASGTTLTQNTSFGAQFYVTDSSIANWDADGAVESIMITKVIGINKVIG